MRRPRLSIDQAPIPPGRRGGGSGEPASQPVSPLAGSTIDADLPLLVDSREVARLLGVGRTKAFELMARDQVPVVRIGRSVRVLRAALERWVSEQAVRQAVDQGKRRGGGLF
jgi:excisionase family DNA binding protein